MIFNNNNGINFGDYAWGDNLQNIIQNLIQLDNKFSICLFVVCCLLLKQCLHNSLNSNRKTEILCCKQKTDCCMFGLISDDL